MDNQYFTYEYFDYPGRFKDGETGQRFARYLIEGLRNDALAGSGSSNSMALQPGYLFTLTSHPREEFNTAWQLLRIMHVGKQPDVLESGGEGSGTTLRNVFSWVPERQRWRPAPHPKPVIPGPQTAVVVGPESEEIWTDEQGRVCVHMQWDREGACNGRDTCWLRVSQGWAGAGFGMMTIPRIGQEVIIDYLNGDPDQPLITGRVYNADNLPPLDLPVKKTQSTLRSKTHRATGLMSSALKIFRTGRRFIFMRRRI